MHSDNLHCGPLSGEGAAGTTLLQGSHRLDERAYKGMGPHPTVGTDKGVKWFQIQSLSLPIVYNQKIPEPQIIYNLDDES